jgi:signal transduction histidine kinase
MSPVSARGGGFPRAALMAALLLPVSFALALAAADAFRPGELKQTPCWILPNLRALAAPADADCPIGVRDAVRQVRADGRTISIGSLAQLRELVSRADGSLRVAVERDGRPVWLDLPVESSPPAIRAGRWVSAAVAAVLLLAIPILLFWRGASAAAAPLAAFYAAFSVVVVSLVVGRSSAPASIAALLGLTIAPAALSDLAFCFPRPTRVGREVPAIRAIPYAASALLLVLGAVAMWRSPPLWPVFLYLLVAVSASAWLVMICSCAFAMRESESALARTRARLVLVGSLSLPAIPAVALAVQDHVPAQELGIFYLWSAAATMPLPIALAISRYNLFDLGFDVRQGIARGLYVSAVALVLAGGAWIASVATGARDLLPGAIPLLALCFASAVAVDPLRTRMPGLLESMVLPGIRRLRESADHLRRELADIDDEDVIVARLEAAIASGVEARGGCVFLNMDDASRPVGAFGSDPPARARLADAARAALGFRQVLDLVGLRDPTPASADLAEAGVAVIASLASGGDELGLLLLARPKSRLFYTGNEIDFIVSICGLAGSALSRSRASALRVARERQAEAGRLALALAHDTGKDLGWLRRLSARLASAAPTDLERMKRDAAMIAELSEELIAAFRGVLDQASAAASASPHLPRFDEIVERCVRRLGNLHGRDRITDVVDPSLRGVRCSEHVVRVLGNILDNALHASPRGEPVHVFATLVDDWISVIVEDRGPGIPADLIEAMFEPGVSTRLGEGGSGLGLTAAREIAEMLGGGIQLEPRAGGGTTASIRIPLKPAIRGTVS